jgi:hypothetical protein
MHSLAANVRMEMRFDLTRRRQGTVVFAHIPGPGLGVPHQALPGVGEYRFHKTIRNLTAPADYRVTITFRWLGQDGAVLSEITRSSPLCRQTEQRPDLRVGGIQVAPAPAAGQATYTVEVRNTGSSAADSFRVGLSVGGSRLPAARIGGLRPGERRTVSFTASACGPGDAVVASVDVDRHVDEASEANNAQGMPCPVATLVRR